MELAPKTCMVVDDSDFDRKVVEACMGKLGFSVHSAASAEEALSATKKSLPDCYLIDWEMPGMKGIDLLQQLRRIEGAEDIPIIFCTAHEHPSFIGHAFVLGAAAYITKPITLQKVEEKLKTLGLLRDVA